MKPVSELLKRRNSAVWRIEPGATMFDALELLRPLLPPQFVRTNSAQAVVRAVTSAKAYVQNSNKQ